MSSDLLEQAKTALQEELSTESPAALAERARATRARVLAAAAASKSQRRVAVFAPRRWPLLVAAAVVVVVGTAAAGSAVRRWVAPPVEMPPVELVPSAQTSAQTSSRTSAQAPPQKGDMPTPEPSAPEAPSSAQPAPVASSSASTALGAEPNREELFYRAQRLHFESRDYPRALAAWDAYLREAPYGKLAPEARYNRAMVLLHLGRNEEARAALRPFAAGAYGAYRQAEAKALLEGAE
jgi:tetratricopeptide (TPR) repeat protein